MLRRDPTSDELADALGLLADLRPDSSERDTELYRWSTLVQALFATAEFRYVR
jgi:hypothetical protein